MKELIKIPIFFDEEGVLVPVPVVLAEVCGEITLSTKKMDRKTMIGTFEIETGKGTLSQVKGMLKNLSGEGIIEKVKAEAQERRNRELSGGMP